MTDAPERKPCPFCGGESVGSCADIGKQSVYWSCFVFCSVCGASTRKFSVDNGNEDKSDQAATDAWNARADLAPQWQPIETAPSGELLLGHEDGMMRLIYWESGVWKQVGATIEKGWFEPTHWQPLPDPPESDT